MFWRLGDIACALALTSCSITETYRSGSPEAVRLSRVAAQVAALQLRGGNVDGYALAEAIAWNDFVGDAWAQGERGAVVSQALTQAEAALRQIECCGSAVRAQVPTPLVLAGASTVRTDLWQQLEVFWLHESAACVRGDIARLRVSLIAASYATADLGWRHARPYVQAAERYAKNVARRLEHCATGQQEDFLPPVRPTASSGVKQSDPNEAFLVSDPKASRSHR